MTDQDEGERLRRARMALAQELSDALNFALGASLQSEAAVISTLISAVLTNKTTELLTILRTTKPSA